MVPPGAGTVFEGAYPAIVLGDDVIVHVSAAIGAPFLCGAASLPLCWYALDWQQIPFGAVCRDCWTVQAAPHRLDRLEQEVAQW